MRGSRILKLERHLPEFEVGAHVRAAVPLAGLEPEMLKRFGFEEPFSIGQSVLPNHQMGAASRRNASGWEEVHRDQPKEDVTRLLSWRRMEWHGDHQVEVDDFVQRSYKRYPRSYFPGHGVEFTILERGDGVRVVASPVFDTASDDEAEALRTAANVLLEGFGEAEFVRANLVPVLDVPIRKLNWNIFPAGRLPWDRVNQELDRVIAAAPQSAQPVIRSRIERVKAYRPDFAAIGKAGFSGYWVFGFTESDVYVLESRMLDNATYVLGADWESVSGLTKAEVINSELALARIVHDRRWSERLDEALRGVAEPEATEAEEVTA